MDQINVYFHMRNHYRKLENVKSRVNSYTNGTLKSCTKTSLNNYSLHTLSCNER